MLTKYSENTHLVDLLKMGFDAMHGTCITVIMQLMTFPLFAFTLFMQMM